MNTGDRLHPPAVAMRESGPIHGLRPANIGATVAADWNGIVHGQAARHARAPQHLVADRAVNELVDLGELLETPLRTLVHAGDELELRLAEISCDGGMGERRPQEHWVRRGGEPAVRPHAQALLFDPAPEGFEYPPRERVETLLKRHRRSAVALRATAGGRVDEWAVCSAWHWMDRRA